jgi:hypothetical protein
MLTRSQWNRFDHMQSALVVVSTKAGQNVIQGVRRATRGVLPATRSNPLGFGTIVRPGKANPLVTAIRSVNEPLGNSIRLANGKHKPVTITFGDCVKHREALAASL